MRAPRRAGRTCRPTTPRRLKSRSTSTNSTPRRESAIASSSRGHLGISANQRIQIDVGLSRGPDVTDLKAVRAEAIFHEAGLLRPHHRLESLRHGESG